ncbi:23S rRNA pseudouridine(955/2504/2580) synthase RluC [Catenovulum sp. SM1970]|uniref:23S rRNA pseudouridine(955/2504/2580) synthase RluC n=1 Tax=Marinifaba aquimaris TaxID=2741323 RepID=UPI00157340D6|nr:23S rRNA pseudouridine(955/2504/2580) synthase RluC [Marinifaba aquimaris]NTS77950.1 23S rRNA pseudouridine(955/2504/2580) synthase RluC [Marinifaba aquimaris]
MNENERRSVSFEEVDDDICGQRIDNFLKRKLKGVPTTLIYRIIRKGEVRVNKKRIKPEYKLQPGDLVRIPPVKIPEAGSQPKQVGQHILTQVEQSILFEDDSLLIVNKPSGLAVHGGSGLNFGLIEAVRKLRPLAKCVELVHRLDRDTSGCIVIAKKRSVLKALHEQLRTKKVDKRYWALVKGNWPEKLRQVEKPLHKNQLASGERLVKVDPKLGKASLTRFKVLNKYNQATLIEAFPVTGRTHQIRVHTAASGYPIAGDDKYGDRDFDSQVKPFGIKRLFLHAASISFIHPKTETTLRVEAPLTDNLDKALKALNKAGK